MDGERNRGVGFSSSGKCDGGSGGIGGGGADGDR